MATQASVLQVSLDQAGIFVFALSGALVGIRNRLDIVGVLVLAGVTVPALAGLVAFRFHPVLGRLEGSINVFDALDWPLLRDRVSEGPPVRRGARAQQLRN